MTLVETGPGCNFAAESITKETTTMSDDWLSKEISQIITSPHISFPNPTGSLPFRMGPGPVDLFSTRFNNTFAYDVKATVDGQEVSREGLKAKLLGLQKYWNAEVKFQDESVGPVRLSFANYQTVLRLLTVRAQCSETVVHFSTGKTISMSAEWAFLVYS